MLSFVVVRLSERLNVILWLTDHGLRGQEPYTSCTSCSKGSRIFVGLTGLNTGISILFILNVLHLILSATAVSSDLSRVSRQL